MPLFGWLCGRYRRAVFLPWTYGFFILNLLAFWAVFRVLDDDVWTARVFFVWVSVFNLFVVSVFWSFMADLFDREQAKRMFAFIAGGASTAQSPDPGPPPCWPRRSATSTCWSCRRCFSARR